MPIQDLAADDVPMQVRPGEVLLEKFRVDRILGEGGMGYVVAATHLTLGTQVAIKLLRTEHTGRADFTARFLREARSAAGILSEHVARVLDVGLLPHGSPYMVLELLQGVDLGEELARRRKLPVEDAVEYVLQACEALAEAHAKGLVHRDLKPSNLFLTRRADGSAMIKLLDFGIAKAVELPGSGPSLTSTGSTIGSPLYMAPEQIRDARSVDARADVWSLGIVLFELISGESPFMGETSGALFAAIAADPPKLLRSVVPDAPVEIERAILSCLEKDPRKRTASVAALAEDLAVVAPPRSRLSIERVKGTLAKLATTADEPVPAAARTALSSFGEAATAPAEVGSNTRSPRRLTTTLAVGGVALALLATGALMLASGRLESTATAPSAASGAIPAGSDRVPVASATTEPSGAALAPSVSASVTLTPVPAGQGRTPAPSATLSTTSAGSGGAKRVPGSPPAKTGNGLIDSRRLILAAASAPLARTRSSSACPAARCSSVGPLDTDGDCHDDLFLYRPSAPFGGRSCSCLSRARPR